MATIITTNSAINWTATGYERKIDCVANILKTKIGEVPFMRGMGIDPLYIDTPISISKGKIISDAVDAIQTYEPRATIDTIEVETADYNGELEIKVVVEFD